MRLQLCSDRISIIRIVNHSEFSIQLRAFDPSRSGAYLGLPILVGKRLKGGLIAVGAINLGGSIDPVYNAISIAELAVEKGAEILLIPVSARSTTSPTT